LGLSEESERAGCTIKREFPCDGKAERIIVIRVFNRLKEDDLHKFLINARKSLAQDGILHLYAIDHDAAIAWANGDESKTSNLYGPKWRSQNYWIRNWKKEEIVELFRDYGFDWLGVFPTVGVNVQYPSFNLIFKKSNYNKTPYEYCNIQLPEGKIVDIGPGNYPLPGAIANIERIPRITDPDYDIMKLPKDIKTYWGDLERGIEQIPDKEFDFAYCSHVMEHVDNPRFVAAEISRIAKRGVIIVPSAYKETLMLWPEDDHKWDISRHDNQLIFVKRDLRRLSVLRDSKITSNFTHLYKTEIYETDEQRRLKRWFYDNEKDLDIVFYWDDSFVQNIIEV
jgi:hypothetical protein